MGAFLSAEWRKLIMVNYEVDSNLLKPYLPIGTEIDLWKGRCYVSLVGFMFLDTRLLGIPIPFHRNFEEVNLRFYVKRLHEGEWRRGVVFIKEVVPKRMLSAVANTVYKEHYQTMPMSHEWKPLAGELQVVYRWGKQHALSVLVENRTQAMREGSEEAFIAEHYWGYTRVSHGCTYQYEVKHPKWEVYPIISHNIDVDFGACYGDGFSFLSTQTPTSVLLAEGSEIEVLGKSRIV